MKVEGVRELPVSRDKAWEMLMNPDVLARCLPGCEGLEPAGENIYKAAMKIGLPAAKGSYSGTVKLENLVPPNSFKLTLEGKGLPGFVLGSATITLTAQGEATEVRYSGEVQVGGLIASVGQRMLGGMATTMLHQFFEAFEREIRSA